MPMARCGVQLLSLLLLLDVPHTSLVTAAKVRASRSLLGDATGRPSSRRELRLMGADRLKARVLSLKQEVGELEVALDKAKKESTASLGNLQGALDKTKAQFPKTLPLRSADEKKLDANIAKTEALIGDVHTFTLAHAKVASKARDELEQLAKKLAQCKCSGSKQKVSLLQLAGGSTPHVPFHLTEEQISAMVSDLGTGFVSERSETQADSAERGAEDDSAAVEDLVRQVEELERKRDDLEESRSLADQAFREAQSRLLDQSRSASKELFAAKISAAREQEDAEKRARALARQQKYASSMLSEQEVQLERVKAHISNYTSRIRSAAALIKQCGCLKEGEEVTVWEPPEVTSTTTTTITTTAAVDEKKARTGGNVAVKAASTTTSTTTVTTTKSAFRTTQYNSWDADMETGKLGDADILLYEAPADSVKSVRKNCLFTAGSHTRAGANVNKMWCYPGPYWGMSEKESSDDPAGKGPVHDMSLLPPSDADGKRSIVLRFTVPRDGTYTLDLFGAKRFRGGRGFVNVLFYVNDGEKLALTNVSDATLPTTTNSENKVHQLGTLAADDFLYFAATNAGDGADDDDAKLRFRITAVTKNADATSQLQDALAKSAELAKSSLIEGEATAEDVEPSPEEASSEMSTEAQALAA